MRKLVLLALTAFAPASMAATVAYNFTGEITIQSQSPSGIFAGQGSNVTGSFTFDDGLVDVDQHASNPFLDAFISDFGPNRSKVFGATLTLGAVTVTQTRTFPDRASLSLINGSVIDSVDIAISGADITGTSFGLSALDIPPGGDSNALPGTGNLTGTAAGAISILDNLDPGLFGLEAYGLWNEVSANGELLGRVDFEWTGIGRATVVPLPGALILLASGLLGFLGAGARGRFRVSAQ